MQRLAISILYLTARRVLEANKNKEDFKENIEALSRVINIATKSESQGEIKTSLFENDYEQQFIRKICITTRTIK